VQTLLAIRQDPRLLHQWLKRNVHQVIPANMSAAVTEPTDAEASDVDDQASSESEMAESEENAPVHLKSPHARGEHADWSVSLGANGAHIPTFAGPAKFSFDLDAPPNCANDFVVFPTFLSGTQATILAYNNLYSTKGGAGGICGSAGPGLKWAYIAGGGIGSSPSLSLDGTKVAWVARSPARVHVLTIGTTGANGASLTLPATTPPATPGVGNNAVDRNFPLLNGGAAATRSALFVDYADDVAYVGDDAGLLHKITGVFLGTPAEVTTGGWPVTVTAGAVLTLPVFDFQVKNIYVTDGTGHLSYVRDVGSTVGTCAAGAPPCKGANVVTVSSTGAAIQDGPIVDTSTGRVFTETANGDGTHAQIVQADTALGSVVRVSVGQADAANPLHGGAFDNNYFNAVNTGHYYVCGKAATGPARPTLYSIGFNAAGVLTAPLAATIVLARAATQCSPITEFFNTGATPQTDWLFVGVNTSCSASGGLTNLGCMMSFNVTSGMPAGFAFRAGPEVGGTSGIVVDNVSTALQASSIYFSSQLNNGPCGDGSATGGCAVKLTQSGLN